MFQRGRGRPPGSGRKPGQKNKMPALRQSIQEYCESIGYDPLRAMADIANDPANGITIRLDAHKTLARYMYPYLSSIEHTGAVQQQIEIEITWHQPEQSDA